MILDEKDKLEQSEMEQLARLHKGERMRRSDVSPRLEIWGFVEINDFGEVEIMPAGRAFLLSAAITWEI